MVADQRKDFWQEIRERHVLQVMGLYLGGSWVALEFTGFIADHYDVSPYVIDLLLLGVAGMLPSVVLLAWTHGRPGKDRWTLADKIVVPVNVLLTMGLMLLFFSGKELGATTLERTGEDESGATVTRMVPKSVFRKRIGLFFFDNRSGDDQADWVGHWLPYGLYLDLVQDFYFDNRHPYQMSAALVESGAPDGVAPLALSREIARRYHLVHFLEGALTSVTPYTVTTRLYLTKGSRLVAGHSYTDADLGVIVDQMSVDIKEDLELPAGHVAEVEDLPVSAISTDNASALENFTLGLTELIFNHDWKLATRLLSRATAADPTFALAQFYLYQANLLQGRESEEAIRAAMQHLYKVPERLQGAFKEVYYLWQGEPGKALSALNLDVSLFPDDVIARRRLASFHYRVGQYAESLEEYQVIRELNPDDDLALRDMAEVLAAMGQFNEALEYLRAYSKTNPRDTEVLVEMGDVFLLHGQTRQAAKVYERAALLGHNPAKILVKQAQQHFREGHYQVALATAREAVEAGRSTETRVEALHTLEGQLQSLGRIADAMAVAREAMPLERRLAGPMNGVLLRLAHFNKYANTTLADSVLARLAGGQQAALPDPWGRAAGVIRVTYKVELPSQSITEAEFALVDSFYSEYKYLVDMPKELIMARIATNRGEYVKAIQGYISTLSRYPQRLLVQRDMARAYRLMGDGQAARTTIDQLLKAYPHEPSVLYELYRIQVMNSDPAATRTLAHLLDIWQNADDIFLPPLQVRESLLSKSAS